MTARQTAALVVALLTLAPAVRAEIGIRFVMGIGLGAEIVVGFVTGLSGPVASIGIPNGKGLSAGHDYIGTIGGESVRIIQLDDGSDPTTAARNARKLVEQDHVDCLIGTSGAPQTTAMAAVAAELKVPMVAISPLGPFPQGEGGPWVVQIPQPVPLLIQGVVDDMKARGIHTVGYIGFGDALGDLFYNALAKEAPEAGIKVVADERYGRADTSVTAQVLKLLATRPDAVLLGGTGTPGALPVLAIHDRGYRGVVYGNHGLISNDFLKVAGKSAEGIIAPTGPVTAAEQLPANDPVRTVSLAFQTAYAKVNGGPPTDGFAAYGFDGWLAFADAAKRAVAAGAKPGTEGFHTALRTALFSTKELVGTQGIYNFAPGNVPWVDARARIMVRIDDGKYKLIPHS